METKVCSKCKEEKELSCFSKHKSGKNGVRSNCKICDSVQTKNYTSSGKWKKTKRKLTLNGRCKQCSQQRLTTSKYCLKHFVYQIVSSWKLPKDIIEETIEGLITKLEQSEYCCHYSGLKITPGFSASVDHRIPQAKGGTHQLSNLVWCHKSINTLKSDSSEKEFINQSAHILVELNYLDSRRQL